MLLVVGSVALDSVETPFGSREGALGGSATYFAAAASLLAPVDVGGVGGGGGGGSRFPSRPAGLPPGAGRGSRGAGARQGAHLPLEGALRVRLERGADARYATQRIRAVRAAARRAGAQGRPPLPG